MRPPFHSNVSTSVEFSNQRIKVEDTEQDIFYYYCYVFFLVVFTTDIQTQTFSNFKKSNEHNL